MRSQASAKTPSSARSRKRAAPVVKRRKKASVATTRKSHAAAAKRTPATAKKSSAAAKKPPSRGDLGAPVDGWFARQPQPQQTILDALRALVHEAAPDAVGSLKWGMPFYTLGGRMMCALTSHRAHVNLVLSGPSDSFADPDGRLEGASKAGRHLKLRTIDELPRAAVLRWLRTAASFARPARA